ncbi:unnamed protein product [Pedinophyceae sp. YPF-701]|nr:unnamed protein product [Pedinophyceae sp. YPF-701]
MVVEPPVANGGAYERIPDEDQGRQDGRPFFPYARLLNGEIPPERPGWQAFTRPDDLYGVAGTVARRPGQWPAWEVPRLVLFALVVIPLRLALVAVPFVLWLVLILLSRPIRPLAPLALFIAQHGSRLLLFAFGFHYIEYRALPGCEKEPLRERKRPIMAVSNHSSYLDIVVHCYLHCPGYVARAGTARTPLLGAIAQTFGCLYVERDKARARALGRTVANVSKAVADRAVSNAERQAARRSFRPLCMFPEGTTSNGQQLLHFHRGAFLAGTAVKPYIIKYPPVTVSPTWESIGIVRQLFLLMCAPWNRMEITEMPLYVPNARERADPALYAEGVRREMARVGGLGVTDAGFKEHMDYIAAIKESLAARRKGVDLHCAGWVAPEEVSTGTVGTMNGSARSDGGSTHGVVEEKGAERKVSP